MWWVDLGWMPDVHQATLLLYLLSRMGHGEKIRWKKLMVQDKGSLRKQRPLTEAKENKYLFLPSNCHQQAIFSCFSGIWALVQIVVSSKDKHHSNECSHPFLLAFIAGQMPNGMEYSFGQFGSDILALSPYKISLILSQLLRGKCCWDSLDAVPVPLSSTKYWCVINTFLTPSAKHSAQRSAVGEINSISAKPTTGERLLWQKELRAHIGPCAMKF